MTKDTPEQKQLTAKQQKHLRALGHHLSPSVYMGKEGESDNFIKAVKEALKAHELIKVKLGQNCPYSRQDAAKVLQEASGAIIVQVIGKMVLLYQANKKLARDKRIQL